MKNFSFKLMIAFLWSASIFSSTFATTNLYLEDPFRNQNYDTYPSNYYPYTNNYNNSYSNNYNTYNYDYYRNNQVGIYDNRYGSSYNYYNPAPSRYDYYRDYNYYRDYVSPYTLPYVSDQSRYPGCGRDDIMIGGQKWASCNATDRRTGSDNASGWFFLGNMYSSYVSANGINNTLRKQDTSFTGKSWDFGPCAVGYRLPTRGEWETAQYYARQNNTTIARLLNLPYNGGFMGYVDRFNNVTVSARVGIGGAYWTATPANETPYVMHLGSTLAGYRTDGTDMSQMSPQYRWQYIQNGMELVPGLYQELANVRCIKA